MIKVLIDTNVILDYLLKRETYYEHSRRILNAAFDNKILAFISATTITDIHYIVKKSMDKFKSINLIKDLIKFIDVANVDRNIVIEALNSNFKDFEDAIQVYSSINNNISLIITRNDKDFKETDISIMTPATFINDYL
jgi:predicted nucleic acid-binding protein